MNKKGQIGDTVTWIIGFIVIFFLMLTFVVISISYSKYRGFSEAKMLKSQPVADPYFSNMVFDFLNKEIEGKSLYEHLASPEKTNLNFESICEEFANKHFPDRNLDIFIGLFEGEKPIYDYIYFRNRQRAPEEIDASEEIIYNMNFKIFPNKHLNIKVSK